MTINSIHFPARDGVMLAGTLYQIGEKNGDAVLINAGTGILRRYYDPFAQFLGEQGFSAVTFDYRGIGDSRPPHLRGYAASIHDWGQQDIAGAITWISDNLQPARLFIVGHSAGGQLAGLAPNNRLVKAMVFVAAQSGYWGHWPFPQRFGYAGLWYVMPLVANLWGYLPSQKIVLGENLPRGVACEWAKWCRHPQYLFGYGETLDLTHYAGFSGPILAYSFADDAFAPAAAVEALLRGYSGARAIHKHITPASIKARQLGHFGFFRQTSRDTLWREAVAWLRGQ